MELVCIVCPRGCRIKIENGIVSGNGCKRGEAFAVSETTCPMRSVCSTVATTFADYPVLPVRTWCSKAYAARTSTSSQRQAFIENGAQSGRETALRL